MEMCGRLKELRARKGLSQSEVAFILKVTKSTVSAYERGKKFPSLDVLIKIVKLYDTSADYILGIKSKDNIIIETENLNQEQEKFLSEMAEQLKTIISLK